MTCFIKKEHQMHFAKVLKTTSDALGSMSILVAEGHVSPNLSIMETAELADQYIEVLQKMAKDIRQLCKKLFEGQLKDLEESRRMSKEEEEECPPSQPLPNDDDDSNVEVVEKREREEGEIVDDDGDADQPPAKKSRA